MNILIKNGRVIDPATKTDKISDLYIEAGKIKEIKDEITPSKQDKVIDAKGCYVMPGLIDLHVHLRDPGLTYKEDIVSGSKAAAKGGFTTILAMPNTKPVIDCADRVKYVHNKAKEMAPIHVLQIGAVTKGQAGEELSKIKEMADAGIPAISEDGKSVMNAGLYKEAMKIAAECNIPVFAHCEDKSLMEVKGCVNSDEYTKELGLPGISNAVEDVIVARDILLAKEAGAKLHLCHCSTKDSVEMIRLAKEEGLDVTGEVCPHHFTLTSDEIDKDDSNYKMNPPLRTKEDKEALLEGLKNDIIDVVEACIDGTLDQIDLQFEDNAAVCVVLASDGYPVKYEKGIPMHGFENFKDKEGYYCFHAGTKFKDGEIVTNGGRVLGITATGKDLKEARKNAYEATDWIQFANKYMRHDIGKAIDEA